jgi:hypothetical protein
MILLWRGRVKAKSRCGGNMFQKKNTRIDVTGGSATLPRRNFDHAFSGEAGVVINLAHSDFAAVCAACRL